MYTGNQALTERSRGISTGKIIESICSSKHTIARDQSDLRVIKHEEKVQMIIDVRMQCTVNQAEMFRGVGLLASNYTTLLGQPATRVGHVGALSVSRDGHVVVLPAALEMIPSRFHQIEFTSLVVNDFLKFSLKRMISIEPKIASEFIRIESEGEKTDFTLSRDAIVQIVFIILHALPQ